MQGALIARAPTRLDLGGGWTDVPPYCDREGGAVCNVAITRYATATVATGGHVAARGGRATDAALVRAALARGPLPAAEAMVTSDFPVGAGLGGSAAAGVALAGALAAHAGQPLSPDALAALSRDTEVKELGIAGGYQDHYAAAYGGALLLTFANCVGVERLNVEKRTSDNFVRRGVLLYSGESRISATTIIAVVDAYLSGDARVSAALARMKTLAREMAAALRSGDLDVLGALIGEHWIQQRALHPSITTPRIDAIEHAARGAGALGVTARGASGGGCVLAFAAEGRDEELAHALAPLGERLTYDLDSIGFDVIASMSGEQSTEEAEA